MLLSKPNLSNPAPTTSTKNTSLFIIFLLLGLLIVGVGYYVSRKVSWKPYWIILYTIGAFLLLGSIIIISGSPPATPTSVSAVDGTNQATVSFTGTGGTYAVLSSPGGITAIGSSSPIIITGLTNGTSYTFTVTASNLFGVSASSLPTNAVTPVPIPLIPSNVSAVAGNQSAIVSFTPNGTNATSFVVRSNPGNITVTGTSSPITVSGLTNGTSYTFTVSGVGRAGSSAPSSPSAPVTPNVPLAVPTSVVATAGNSTASIAFTASEGAISYIVTSSPGGITATGSSSPIVVTGLTNGTSYTFTVKAVNGSRTSASSSDSNAVTPSATVDIIANMLSFGPAYMGAGKSWVLTNITGRQLNMGMIPGFSGGGSASSTSFVPTNQFGPPGFTFGLGPGESMTINWNIPPNGVIMWYGMGSGFGSVSNVNIQVSLSNGNFSDFSNSATYIQNQFTIVGQ
jgi:hypothetical protein